MRDLGPGVSHDSVGLSVSRWSKCICCARLCDSLSTPIKRSVDASFFGFVGYFISDWLLTIDRLTQDKTKIAALPLELEIGRELLVVQREIACLQQDLFATYVTEPEADQVTLLKHTQVFNEL